MRRIIRWLTALKETLLHRAGVYRRFSGLAPDFRATRVIFVCKGNVCRSVYAEHFARHNTTLARSGLEIISCGLATDGGTPANDMGKRVAAERGIDLDCHASTCVQDLAFDDNDLLIVMEPGMIEPLSRYYASGKTPQVLILGLLGERAQTTIPDPYGKPKEVFERVFDTIETHVESLARRLT